MIHNAAMDLSAAVFFFFFLLAVIGAVGVIASRSLLLGALFFLLTTLASAGPLCLVQGQVVAGITLWFLGSANCLALLHLASMMNASEKIPFLRRLALANLLLTLVAFATLMHFVPLFRNEVMQNIQQLSQNSDHTLALFLAICSAPFVMISTLLFISQFSKPILDTHPHY